MGQREGHLSALCKIAKKNLQSCARESLELYLPQDKKSPITKICVALDVMVIDKVNEVHIKIVVLMPV